MLWRAIYALSQLSRNKHKRIHIFIYAGGKDMSGDAILDKARDTFGIDLRTGDGETTVPITFVHLRYRWLLEPSWYVSIFDHTLIELTDTRMCCGLGVCSCVDADTHVHVRLFDRLNYIDCLHVPLDSDMMFERLQLLTHMSSAMSMCKPSIHQTATQCSLCWVRAWEPLCYHLKPYYGVHQMCGSTAQDGHSHTLLLH